jgi:hypothetical protein
MTAYPYRFDPWAPYGRDPINGQPLSDKSQAVAILGDGATDNQGRELR